MRVGISPTEVLVIQPQKMPPIRAPNSRIQRHFSPLVVQTVFKPEIFLSSPAISYRVVYSVGDHAPEKCLTNPDLTDPARYRTDPKLPLIPKPPGEVTRLSRNGYKLQTELEKHLGWTEDEYQSCLVSSNFSSLFYL